MFERLMDFFGGGEPRPAADPNEGLRLAVAAVLIEAAMMDDLFDAAERRAIEAVLARRFDLTPEATHSLVEDGARAIQASVQLHGFLRRIRDSFGPAERLGLVEMMWEVVYADGALDPHEDALIRRIAGLVDVSDRDRGEARRRVRQRLGLMA